MRVPDAFHGQEQLPRPPLLPSHVRHEHTGGSHELWLRGTHAEPDVVSESLLKFSLLYFVRLYRIFYRFFGQ